MGTRCADHVTPLYSQKLALTSPTGGGRSVGIVRLRTKATELSDVGYNIRLMLLKATLASHFITPINSKKKGEEVRMCEF